MKIFFIDPNNSTPQTNYPMIEKIEESGLNIIYLTSYNRWNSKYYDENYSTDSLYIFFRLANKIPNQKVRQILKILVYPINLMHLLVLILRYKPDILHFNNITVDFIDNIFFRFLKVMRYKIILTQHNFIPHGFQKVSKKRLKIYEIVNSIICLSNYTKSQFPSGLKHKILYIPHGNTYDKEIQKFGVKKRKLDNEYFKILFIGLLRPYKGIELLIEGFSLLPEKYKKKIKVNIIGNAHNIKYLAELKKKASIHKNICIINKFMDYEEMIFLINNSDSGILPYVTATQSGIPYLFAGLFKPLIVTNVGALSEQIDESFAESCLPNAISISDAIINLYNRVVEKTIKEKSFDIFNQKNQISSIKMEYIDLYIKILNNYNIK